MAKIPPFPQAQLESICNILAATNSGMTGSEIGRFLAQIKVPDVDPTNTKRLRLYNALASHQNKTQCGNHTILLIKEAMNPVRHTDSHEYFEDERHKLNKVLLLCGFSLREDGEIVRQTPATSIGEASQRASRLRSELERRKVHPDVLRFCKAEFLQSNYFHAVFEATKSIAVKVREKAGVQDDGHKLVDRAFGTPSNGYPLLAFNKLETQTDKSEHLGYMNMMKGVFSAFRNVTAHEAKVEWSISEDEALDILTLASLLHKKLDVAFRTHQPL